MKKDFLCFVFCFLFIVPLTYSKDKQRYRFCWGKRKNGAIFCSGLDGSENKGDLKYCKAWSKSRFKDTVKWGYKTIITGTNPYTNPYKGKYDKFCKDNVHLNIIKEDRHFYFGCIDKKGKSNFIDYKMTSKEYDRFYNFGEMIICDSKKNGLTFDLHSGSLYARPSFGIFQDYHLNEDEDSGVFYDLLNPFKDFYLKIKGKKGGNCYAMSSQRFEIENKKFNINPKDIDFLDLKKILNPYNNHNISDFSCHSDAYHEHYEWEWDDDDY